MRSQTEFLDADCTGRMASRELVTDGDVEPGKVQRAAAALLHQQIWCWGRDILCHSGNLLVRYGLHRIPPPAGSDAPSIYYRKTSARQCVLLRGFGVFYGDEQRGGIFVRRCGFEPQRTPGAELTELPWTIDDLPHLAQPELPELAPCRSLLLDLVGWIGRFEAWVQRTQGVSYRVATLTRWDDGVRQVVPAEQMVEAWRRLGQVVADRFECFLPDH